MADALCLLLAWDPSIDAAVWFRRDADRKLLRGQEAVDSRHRDRARALASRVLEWARALHGSGMPLTGLVVRDEGDLPVFDEDLSRTARRLKFSTEDTLLHPVAALLAEDPSGRAPLPGAGLGGARSGGSPAAGDSSVEDPAGEDPAELARAFGDGAWSYVPVRGTVKGGDAAANAAFGVLAVRTAQAPPDELRGRWSRWAALFGRVDERAQAARATRLWHRERQLLDEASGDLNAVSNVADLVQQAARSGARLASARWAMLWLHDAAAGTLLLKARSGSAPSDESDLEHLEGQARAVMDSMRVRVLASPGGDAEVVHLPLVAFDRALGVLAVGGCGDPVLADSDRERALCVLARQTAVSVRNAELTAEVKKSRVRARELETRLQQTERLADLGELAAKLAHEVRSPLTAIEGFARRIERALPDGDPSAKYAALVAKEVRRLEMLLAEQLEFIRLSEPRLQSVSVVDLVKASVGGVKDALRQREVHCVEDYEPGLPPLLLDHSKIRQALDNVLVRVVAELEAGSTVRASCRRVGGAVEVELAHDGATADGDILEKLFIPFATRTAGGGLGLALAKQIVDDHGGEIVVRSGEPWRVSFVLRFPIRTNQDRRKSQRDRRGSRDRRRAA